MRITYIPSSYRSTGNVQLRFINTEKLALDIEANRHEKYEILLQSNNQVKPNNPRDL